MHKNARKFVFVAIAALPAIAQAAPNCTSDSRDKWMPEEAMREKATTLGYERIKTFKISGNCYEIYGYTKDGRKAEVYFNPVTGDIVKSNIGG
jgi:hypothetical protein